MILNYQLSHRVIAALAASIVLLSGCRTQKPTGPESVEAQTAPDKEWKAYTAYTVDRLPGYRVTRPPRESKYGGLLEKRFEAAGFFRTKKIGDRWWLVDPDGYLFIHRAVVAVSPGGSAGQKAALKNQFGTEQEWMNRTIELLRSYGFNGAGNWSSEALIRGARSPFPYTARINPMSRLRNVHREEHGGKYTDAGWQGYEHDLLLLWDPRFEQFVEEDARQLVVYRDDPNLLGVFSDNELPFKNDALDRHLLRLEKNEPGYMAARTWFEKRKGPNATPADITTEDRQAFLAFYADRYFSVVSKAIRKYVPNHLYLGSRFNQEKEELASRAIMETAGKYADVISVNIYRVWEPGQDRLKNWATWSGRPVMVTEWYTKGNDAGMANTSGAGWIVRTQRDRGLFYQNFVLELLKSGVCVGWHWFRYQDNDPTDLTTDPSNRDSNKGVVDAKYVPYESLLNEMKSINTQTYNLIEYFDAQRSKSHRIVER